MKKSILTEDWAVVVLGFLIIAVVLSGLAIPVPSFGWKNSDDLFSKVLSPENILKITLQFVVLFVVAVLGALITGKNLKSFSTTFVVIYLLTLFALVLAGNTTVKEYNLEAVIFSLLIGLVIGNVFNLPQWFRSSITSELFVKIGLVLLGTSIIFSDILKAGALVCFSFYSYRIGNKIF